MSNYDGIVLGTGHNGLIAQAYLAKAGLKTLSVDRLGIAGGGLRTEENPRHPGVLHNTHAFFHRAASDMPWYKDLELKRHGAEYIEPEVGSDPLLRQAFASQLKDFPDFNHGDLAIHPRLLAPERGPESETSIARSGERGERF